MRSLIALCCIVLLNLGDGAFAAHDNNYCKLSPPAGVLMPAAPTIYNLVMSMRDEKGGRTSAVEYFNGNLQKTSFSAYTPEGSYRAVFDFVTRQIQVINLNSTRSLLDSCQIENIRSPDVLTPVQLGSTIYYLPSKFFFGGGGVNIERKGQTTIDGIPVNEFYSCYYWSGFDTSMKINWYFTTTAPIQPLRVVVQGQDNANRNQFSLTHDISRFGEGAPSYAARFNPFMAPPGLYCRNLNSQGRKPQSLPDKFSMRIERMSLGSSTSTYLKEAYDFKSNMSYLVGYPPETSGDSAKYGAGKLLYIHDFRRGLSYIRNEDMGNCTYEKLTIPEWDSQKDGNQLRMKTPREFFDLDTDNVQYKGAGYTRDILTDIFISYKQLDLGVPGLKFDTTIEWYFANRTYVDPHTKATIIQSIPMSMLITSDASWLSARMFIYDFEQNDIVFNRHDIAACFNNDAKMHFQVYFPLANDRIAKYIRDRPNDFTSLLIPIIAGGLNVSPLRVLNPEVTVSGSTAILELTVTDKPKFQSDTEETPLSEMEQAFNILVNKGDVLTAINVDKDFFVITANRVAVVEERSNNLKSIGYSAGALVGIGFAMVIVGLGLGVAVIFGVYKYRGGTLMGVDPFQPQRM